MTIRIPLEIVSSGAQKTVAEFQAIQQAIAKAKQEGKGYGEVGKELGSAQEQAKKLGKEYESVGKSQSDSQKDQQKGNAQTLAGLAEMAFKFNNVIGAVQNLAAAAKPAYDALIGSNEKLNAQLLSSQTNLASSTRLFQGGIEITDPTEKINASRPALQAALKQVEKDTQSLVGVTSSQVNELFQITLTNAASINNQSKQFPDAISAATSLTKGWAASLKVIGVPLDQARQEINSIIKGQIDNNSILAKNLNLTNEQVNKYKSQGTLVDELNKRLNVFVAGNAIAARSVDGISSNIQDLFERIAREAGKPLLDPIVDSLAGVESFLKSNEGAITGFLGAIADGTVVVTQEVATNLAPLLESLIGFAGEAAPLAENLFGIIGQGLVGSTALLAPLLTGLVEIIAKATEGLAALSELAALNSINDGADAIAALTEQTNRLNDQALATGAALKALNDLQAKGIPLTAAQAEEQKKLIASGKLTVTSIDEQIKALKSVNAVGEDNRKQRDSQVASLEALKTALGKTSGAFSIQGQEVTKLGTSQEQYAKKAEEALNQIKSQGGGDSTVFQKSAKDLIKITQDQVKAGQITAEQAEIRLTAIKNNSKVEVETQESAKDTIAKIRKDQSDAEIATLQTGQSAIAALRAQGNLGEAEADKQTTALKLAEIQKRLEANRSASENATGTDKTKLLAEEKKLQSELDQVKADAQTRDRKRLIEDYDERLKILQAGFETGKVVEGDYLKQRTQLQVQQSDEELKQQQDALARLGANDKEGREAVLSKIAEIETKKAKAIADGLKAQIALIDRFVQESQAKLVLAESERQSDIQRLLNAGAIDQQQSEALKLNSTRDRLGKEFALAQEQLQKLSALPKPDSPDAVRDLENKKQDARKKTADLTLQLLQNEYQKQEQLRAAAIKSIDDQLAARTRAYDRELSQIDATKQARDRAGKDQESLDRQYVNRLDIAGKALDRQNALLTARVNLQKAQADALSSDVDIKIAAIDQALQIDQSRGLQKNLALIRERRNLENDAAKQKRAALIEEQEAARASAVLQARQNDLAGRRQLIEAQIAESKAQQNVLDAQSALQQTRVTDQKAIGQAQSELDKANALAPGQERDRAVAAATGKVGLAQNQATQNQANAQQGVVLAQDQVALAASNTQAVREQIANQGEINQLQAQTLEIEQATALKRFDGVEALRQQRVQYEAIADAAGKAGSASLGFTPVALPARKMGGSVSPGQPFIGGEEGAEAVKYGDGSYGLLPSPGIYEVPRSGVVFTAAQTASLMAPVSRGIVMPQSVQSGGGDAALIREVQGLRSDIAKLEGNTTNQFQIVADEDPYRRMANIAATVNRSRWK